MSEPPEDVDAAPPVLIETADALAAFVERTRRASVLALDIEANSLHAYRERACVLQATADGESAIVDLLALDDLSSLAQVVARDDVEVVFHGGDFDVSLLARDHGFRFRHVFDTMIAAMLLGEEKIGLADLVRDGFAVELDKRFQKADWGRRPLTPEQIDYLHRDTAYLEILRERLRTRLVAEGLVEEAEIEFRRLASRCGQPAAFDPEGWRSLKGAGGLDATGRAILAQLWLWRNDEASRLDRPPFKVLPPRVMVDLAARPPRRLERPDDLRALPGGLRRRIGHAVLERVRAGVQDEREGRAPLVPERPRSTPAERAERKTIRSREDALRAWRREEAKRRGVPNLVVLPNRALGAMARRVPSSTEELAANEDLGPKRAARYGEILLALLKGPGSGPA